MLRNMFGLPMDFQCNLRYMEGKVVRNMFGLPMGFQCNPRYMEGKVGSEYVRAPHGLPVQSQVHGGQGDSEYVRAPDGLPVQSQVSGGQVRLPPGLSDHPRTLDGVGQQNPPVSSAGAYSAQTGGNLEERDVGQVDGHKSVPEPFGVDPRPGGTSSTQGGDGQNQTKVVSDEDAMVGHWCRA